MPATEVNFDGLVGPTHNYAGLAYGNVASTRNKGKTSNPKKAALEGLAKMKFLADLGVAQAVLPPQLRPDMRALSQLGFDSAQSVARHAPTLLAACCSASAMWTANAATVSPSADTRDGKLHFTPANLVSQFHRSLETQATSLALQRIFDCSDLFSHHPPLPAAWTFADEGAANHMRFAPTHDAPGVEVFTYGRDALSSTHTGPRRFPTRQTLQAAQAIARLHRLGDDVVFAKQSPQAIDAGAFHNDVVATSNLNVLLYHELAWEDSDSLMNHLRKALAKRGAELVDIKVNANDVSLQDAVDSYLFNSQLVSLPGGAMALIAPLECRRTPSVRQFLTRLEGSPTTQIHFVPVRQSMRNGGGPACLRLRVVLTPSQLKTMNRNVLFTPRLHDRLTDWIHRHYRDTLTPPDLADAKLLSESYDALDELTRILGLGSIYQFQKS